MLRQLIQIEQWAVAVWTVPIFFVLFIMIVFAVYRKGRRTYYDQAAKLPLDD